MGVLHSAPKWPHVWTDFVCCRWAMGVYWAVIVSVAIFVRSVNRACFRKQLQGRDSRAKTWYKRYVSLPMTLGSSWSRDQGWATVPPRDQAVAATVFVAMNVVLSVVGYRFFEGNI